VIESLDPHHFIHAGAYISPEINLISIWYYVAAEKLAPQDPQPSSIGTGQGSLKVIKMITATLAQTQHSTVTFSIQKTFDPKAFSIKGDYTYPPPLPYCEYSGVLQIPPPFACNNKTGLSRCHCEYNLRARSTALLPYASRSTRSECTALPPSI